MKSTKTFLNPASLIILISFIVSVFIVGFLLGNKKTTNLSSGVINKSQNVGQRTVNYDVYGDGSVWTRFQIDFPARYYVTDGKMLTDYRSLGGMAPPVLIFNAGDQFMPSSKYDGKADCVYLWSGTESFDTWNNSIFNTPVKVLSKKTENIGGHSFEKYVVEDIGTGNKHIQVFFSPNSKTGYLFDTCNTNNETDLDFILNHFRLRADNPPIDG